MHPGSGAEFLRFEHLASGSITAMAGSAQRSFALAATFTVRGRVCRRMKAGSSFASVLREQGYSESAIAEICKWYICSTTNSSGDKVMSLPKN